MADIAREVQANAPQVRGVNNNAIPCGFTNAIDTVRSVILPVAISSYHCFQIQLAQTFLGLAESMRQTRSALIRS